MNFLSDPAAPKRNIMRYSGLSVFAGGTVLGVVSSVNLRTSFLRMQYISDVSNEEMLKNENSAVWKDTEKQYKQYLARTIVGFSAFLAGSVMFTWSFTY